MIGVGVKEERIDLKYKTDPLFPCDVIINRFGGRSYTNVYSRYIEFVYLIIAIFVYWLK